MQGNESDNVEFEPSPKRFPVTSPPITLLNGPPSSVRSSEISIGDWMNDDEVLCNECGGLRCYWEQVKQVCEEILEK